MIQKRIKVSAAFNIFNKAIRSLKNFDNNNQTSFQAGTLTKKQLHLLTESIFFNAFREYENYIRDVFILYTQEKRRMNGDSVKSYLKPRNFSHAEDLLRSAKPFIDWNNPEVIIERSELYLKEGYPIKEAYSQNKERLLDFKKLRNQVAHNSPQSIKSYKSVLIKYYGTVPLTIPSAGEYLLLSSQINTNNYQLMEFFELIKEMANRTS